jgi:hypothetical protein
VSNKPDHIEDSVRKAFEGFELPVTDMDWSRIEAALPAENNRKGFFFWFNKHKGLSLLLLCAAGMLGSGAYYFATNQNDSQAFVSAKKESNKGLSEQDVLNTHSTATDKAASSETLVGQNQDNPNVKSTRELPIATKAISSATNAATQATGATNSTGSDIREVKPRIAETLNPEPVITPPQTTVNSPNQAEEPPVFAKFPSLGFGIHKFISPVLGMLKLPLFIQLHKPADPNTPPITPQFYAGLSFSQAPGAVKQKTGSPIWENYQLLNAANPATDLRLEGGYSFGNQWQFHVGAAFEGNPAQSKGSDSIRIRIADRFLPYMDVNGKVLYWLAVRWRDSVVVINRNPQRVWMEIPLGISRSFDLKNDWKFRAGLTVNPGVMLAGGGEIANPYAQYSGSYLQYQYGIDADTSAAMLQARPFMNNYRIGGGLQLGAEKNMAPYTLGVYLQTRYYSPVWKKETVFNQSTLQYGLTIRLGISLNP